MRRLWLVALAVLSGFTVIGCLLAPFVADRIGRRGALGLAFVLMIIGIFGAYGWAYYQDNINYFFAFIPILGLGGADFALFTIWRASFGFSSKNSASFAFTVDSTSPAIAGLPSFVFVWPSN